MKFIKQLPAILLAGLALGLGSAPANATDKKVDVLGIPADMPKIGKTRCVAPNLCFKKDDPTVATYDSGVWGRAKFREGQITLRDGTVLTGRVALLNMAADWNFVKQIALIVPEGEAAAVFIGSDDALLIRQTRKDGVDIYDRYGGNYLRRLVSGPMRLSYNPAAGTSRPLSDFVSMSVLTNISGAAGREAVIAALRDGKTVSESLEAGKGLGSVVSDALGSIEITEKEYLLYNERSGELIAITKDSYRTDMSTLFANCASAQADAKNLRSLSRKYKKIEEAIEYYNQACV